MPGGKIVTCVVCILSYRSYPYFGGQGIYMRCLSNALRDLGHDVDIWSGLPYTDGVRLIKMPGLDLYTMTSMQRLFIGHQNYIAARILWNRQAP